MAKAKKITPEVAAEAEDFLTKRTVANIEQLKEAGKATRWQKGQTGRKPKAPELPLPVPPTAGKADALTLTLAEVLGQKGAKELAKSLISLATGPKPNLNAIIYIYDRLEGKPRQSEPEKKQVEEPLIIVLNELLGNDRKQLSESTIDATYTVHEIGLPEGDS